jgi:hypothetical protein
MIKARTLRRVKLAAMTACTAMGGTLLSSACTVQDFNDQLQAGTLTAVRNYVTGFWTTLIPTVADAITIAQNAGIPIPNPPWP